MRLSALIVVLGGGTCTDTCPMKGGCDPGGGTGGTDGEPVPLVVDHTDALGVAQSASATAHVDVVRDIEADIHGVELDDPVVIVVDDTAVSLVTGFPLGTLVELHGIEVVADPLQLDRTGMATLFAGVPLLLDLTVTEPRLASFDTILETPLPWDLTVTATEGGLFVARWDDGLGGTFEIR